MRTLFIMLLCIVCSAATAYADESLSCGVCEEEGIGACFDTPGVRINMLGDELQEIDGAAPSFVRHGLAAWPKVNFDGQDPQLICEFYRDIFSMTLSINGALISPDGFDISTYIAEGDLPRWSPSYYFVFPAGYFTRGIHILQATLDVMGMPCELADDSCDELSGGPLWWVEAGKLYGHGVFTVTLTVL